MTHKQIHRYADPDLLVSPHPAFTVHIMFPLPYFKNSFNILLLFAVTTATLERTPWTQGKCTYHPLFALILPPCSHRCLVVRTISSGISNSNTKKSCPALYYNYITCCSRLVFSMSFSNAQILPFSDHDGFAMQRFYLFR